MTVYPKYKKDANGLPIVEGVKAIVPPKYSSSPNDLKNIDSTMAKDLLAKNPQLSAGTFSALSSFNVNGDNELAQKIAAIDAQTKDARRRNQMKEAQDAENAKFQNSIQGKIWNGIKGLTRATALIPQTALEAININARNLASGISGAINKDNKKADAYWNPFSKQNFEQFTIYQIFKQQINEGRIDIGQGFFFSETAGAGFKARERAKEVMKIAVKDNQGKIIGYRPYTVATPLAWILTGGHPESRAGTVIDAIGEMAVTFYADPLSKIAKAVRLRKLADQEVRTTKGVVAAKDAVRKAEVEKEYASLVQEIETASNDLLGSVAERLKGGPKFAVGTEGTATVKTKAKSIDEAKRNLQELIDKEVKLKDELGTINLNPDAISGFLSKKSLEPVLDNLVEQTDAIGIWRASNKKLDGEIALELAKATTREEVLTVLARNIVGADSVAVGKLGLSALDDSTSLGRGLSKITKGATPVAAKVVRGATAATIARTPFINKFYTKMAENYNTVIPRGAMVHKGDTAALLETAERYMVVGKVPLAERNKVLNEILTAGDPGVAGFAASAKAFQAIKEANRENVPKRLLDAFDEATTFFLKEENKASTFWASRQVDDAIIDIVTLENGKKVQIHGIHLDSEFLNSHLYFPPADELMRLLSLSGGKVKGALGGKSKGKELISTFADEAIGNFWKKSVLVRPAFVVRNIMEEQVRVFATGHTSFYNNPLAAISMWLGKSDGGPARLLLSRLDGVRNTVYGTPMRSGENLKDLGDEVLAVGLKNDAYLGFAAAGNIGASDEKIGRILSKIDYTTKKFGEKGWWDGFASQVQILSSSIIGRKVAQTNVSDPAEIAKTVEFFLTGKGKTNWEVFAKAVGKDAPEDFLNPRVVEAYLFSSANSVNARINELAGGLSSVRTLIANRKFVKDNVTIALPSNVDEAVNNLRYRKGSVAADTNRQLADQLEEAFKDVGKWTDVPLVVPQQITFNLRGRNKKTITDVLDGFFERAIRFEKTTTMGPEWRMKYWDVVRQYSSLLDSPAITRLQGNIDDTLGVLVGPRGVNIGKKHGAYKALKDAKGDGPISLDQIHEIASARAGKHVSELFYNASERRLLFHQLRLISPFGQAWADTIRQWSKLALDNPDKLYTISRGLNWLTKPSSSAIYQLTDARDVYDPNQGFFYNDPQFNQRRFFIPFAALPLNVAANLASGKGLSTQGPYVASADPMAINFALQGNGIMPGVGPGITVPNEVLNKLQKNPVSLLPLALQKEVNDFLYPYGPPDIKNKGLFEGGLISNNWARLMGGFAKNEESYASSFAPVLSYLASSGDYNIDLPEDQGRLIRDTDSFSQWFSIMRGLNGLVTLSPSAIIPSAIVKDKTGDTQLQAALYKDFADLQAEFGDRTRAHAEFMDLYGPEAIFSMLGKTTGGPTNLATYELIKQDSSIVDTYKDTFQYFYPYGGYSKEMDMWSKTNQSKRYKTPKEIVQMVTNVRYNAAKDRLSTRAALEGWDSKRFEAGVKELKTSYDYKGREVTMDFNKKDRVFLQFKEAAKDARFDDSDAVAGLRDYLMLRDAALQGAGKPLDGTLQSKGTINQRKWLADQALEIIKRNPEFQTIFYTHFKRELEG
jgi:hypothetical protein